MDVADACRERGVKSVAVTAGYMRASRGASSTRKMDAANVDLKAFTESFYRRGLRRASSQPVLETLVYLKHETQVWFEITTLLIPGQNDSQAEIDAMSQWIDGRARSGRAAALHRVPSRLEDDRLAAHAARRR